MALGKKIINLAGIVIPGLGLIASCKKWRPGKLNATIFLGTYLASGFGITAGYHRQLTHRAYETSKLLRTVHAVLGATALQGPPVDWVRHHRKHHNHSDEEGDPHSPHVGHGSGWLGALRGLKYSHLGWLFVEHEAPKDQYAKDLQDEPDMIWIGEHYVQIVFVSLALPGVATALIERRWRGFARGFYWSGLARAFLLLNFTFSINSICHFFGKRRFETKDKSRNVWWLALPTMGESWHHNHHAFPQSAFHGLRRGEVDLTGLYIFSLERLGLAWNLVRISAEKQRNKEVQIAA